MEYVCDDEIHPGIPEALIESAEMDGANPVRILFVIIMPLSKPMLAAIGLLLQWRTGMTGFLAHFMFQIRI